MKDKTKQTIKSLMISFWVLTTIATLITYIETGDSTFHTITGVSALLNMLVLYMGYLK